MTNRDFTPEFDVLPLVNSVALFTLGIVVAIRLRQHGPLVSMGAAGLVLLAGGSRSMEFCFGYAWLQFRWSGGFYHQSDGWQLGWLIAKLAVVGLFSFGLVRGLNRPASPREGLAVDAP